jgi:WD40 repeat protein
MSISTRRAVRGSFAVLSSLLATLAPDSDAIAQGDRVWSIRGAAGATAIGLSTNQQTLLTGRGYSIRSWSTSDGALRRAVESRQITAPRFSPDGRFAASRTPQFSVTIYDAETVDSIGSIPHDPTFGLIESICFAADGSHVLVASESSVALYTLPVVRQEWNRSSVSPSAFSFSRRGEYIVWTEGGSLSLFRTATGQPVRELDGDFDALESGFGFDDAIVVGYDGRRIVTWSLWDGKRRHEMLDRSEPQGHRMAIDRNGRYAVTWSAQREGDSTMRVWEIERGARIRDYGLADLAYPLRDALVTADGSSFVVLTAHSRATWIGLLDGATARTLPSGPGSGDVTVGFMPDRSAIVIGDADRVMRFYDAGSGALIREYRTEGTVLRFSDDMRTWVEIVRSDPVRLRMRETSTGALLRELPFVMEAPRAVAITPDFATVAWVPDFSDAIRIVSVADGHQIREIGGQGSAVLTLDFDGTGAKLSGYGANTDICMWEVATGGLLRRIGSVGSLARFSPGGAGVNQVVPNGLGIWGVEPPDDRSIGLWAGLGANYTVTPDERWLLYAGVDIAAVDYHEGKIYYTFRDSVDLWPAQYTRLTSDQWSESFVSVTWLGDVTRWRIRGVLAAPDETDVARSMLSIAPGVARDEVRVGHEVAVSGPVAIELFDARGVRVFGRSETREVGSHVESIDVGALAPGVYTVRIRSGDEVGTGRVVVVR